MELSRLLEVAEYIPNTGEIVRKEGRAQWPKGHVMGWITGEGYRLISIDKVQEYAHRAAWAMHYGKWPDRKIDHINRNRLDNRIENLRLADDNENNANQSLRSDNTSGRKGVTWNARRGKWQAQIQYKGVRKSKCFSSIDDAARFYDAMAGELCDQYFLKNGEIYEEAK